MMPNTSTRKEPWVDERSKLQAGLLGVGFRIWAGFHRRPAIFIPTSNIRLIYILEEISANLHRFSFLSVPSDTYVSTGRLIGLEYLVFYPSNVVGIWELGQDVGIDNGVRGQLTLGIEAKDFIRQGSSGINVVSQWHKYIMCLLGWRTPF